MSVPVHTLSKDQKIWYARFVIGAILADDEISPSEVDFLKQVINIVEDPAEKKELMGLISTKNRPPLTPPDGISKEVLAAIFIELILIMISDLDFADQEKEYLQEVSDLFNFSNSYFVELMNWGEEGLKWKESQKYLITDDGSVDSFHVPLDKLSSEQKTWYAQILIATIMLDGQVEDTELQFLKAAMSFLDNKRDQQQLVGYVKNKMSPPLQNPPNIQEVILRLVFFEVILIVSADESLSYTEQNFLKSVAQTCGFDDELLNKAVDWCQKGISWKQNKNPLISRCKFSKKSAVSASHGPLEPHPENNSILFRDFECFVCNSKQKFQGFQLKPHTQEPNRNIFGITTYLESLGDNDYIDFNLIKVFVCPNCFFASTDKKLFKRGSSEKTPPFLDDQKFKGLWLKSMDQHRSMMGSNINELGSIKRSPQTALKTYKLSQKSSQLLAKTTRDQSFEWQAITSMLILAEILMSNGNDKKADEIILQAQESANELFKNASNNLIAIRSARLLFFIALYHNDIRTAGPFVDYIRNLQDQAGSLKPDEAAVLKKVFGETQNALKNRSDFKKEKLFGYHLEI